MVLPLGHKRDRQELKAFEKLHPPGLSPKWEGGGGTCRTSSGVPPPTRTQDPSRCPPQQPTGTRGRCCPTLRGREGNAISLWNGGLCLAPTPYTYTLKTVRMTRWWEYSVKTEGHGARPCCPALHCYLQGRNCGSEAIHLSLLLFTSRGMNQHIRGKSSFSCSWLPLSTSYSECLLAPQQPGHSHCTCIVQVASSGQCGLTPGPGVRKGGPPPPHLLPRPWATLVSASSLLRLCLLLTSWHLLLSSLLLVTDECQLGSL